MNRREFIGKSMLVAGVMAIDMKAFAEFVSKMGEPNIRIGILSDVHIRLKNQTDVLEKTLRYFDKRGVDGVIMAGDLADAGLSRELQWLADTWYKVFPKDRGYDRRHVEKLFIYGNHDFEGQTYDRLEDILQGEDYDTVVAREGLVYDKAGWWKKIFHEKYDPIYIKDVKGYKFIGAHWGNGRNFPGLAEFMDAHRAEIEGSKPFFYYQHQHPKGTCSGPWVWGQDDGQSTQILSQFPNCVAFSGHSHNVLNDERTIWQGAFTSVGTSSLSYTYSFGGRENTYVDGGPYVHSQMRVVEQGDGKQGMVMSVYDDCIVLERREFVYDESVGDNWIIPLPAPGEKTLSFEYRAARAKIPQFAPGDTATVTRGMGKDRDGKENMQTTVHFPTVLKKRTGVRAHDFEVTLEKHDVDTYQIVGQKRVMSPHFHLGENMDEEEATCVFGEDEVPKDMDLRFIIRPCECFGGKGDPIYTDWFRI